MRSVGNDRDTWDVVRELGHGGMGQTVLVRSQTTGELAVLKELHVGHLDDWKALELFEREAVALQSLDHPGIPSYRDAIDEGDGIRALLQSFVDGRTLQEVIDEQGPLSAERVEEILRDCLDILAYLQARVPPVVHRDITPANVLVDAERAYIIDFGSVKWALRDSTRMTSVGTFGYMAPEQVRGRAEPASDMFSLGMTVVALATRMDPSEFVVDSRTGQVDVRAMLRLPGHLVDVLDRMTRPGLAERLSDARRALALLDTPAPASQPSLPSGGQVARVRVLVFAMVVLMGAGVAAAVVVLGGAERSTESVVAVERLDSLDELPRHYAGTFGWDASPGRKSIEIWFDDVSAAEDGTAWLASGTGEYHTSPAIRIDIRARIDIETHEFEMRESNPDSDDFITDGRHVGKISSDLQQIEATWTGDDGKQGTLRLRAER